MKTLRSLPFFLFVFSLFFTACTEQDITGTDINNVDPRTRTQQTEADNENTGNTIVDLAIATPELSILVDAVVAAGLDGVLSSSGNYTVFAPTNDAFVALLNSTGFASLDDIPVDVLTEILLTHVINQELFAADLSTSYVKTLAEGPQNNPTDIFINTMNGVSINGNVNVLTPNIDASNGVIHIVDAVILPSDIVTLAVANPNFSTLVAALTRPDLPTDFVSVLSSDGPFTVVAPTNAAFQDLLDSNPAWNTLADIPAAVLDTVLKYHVTNGNGTSNFLIRGAQVTTLNGEKWRSGVAFNNGSIGVKITGNTNMANVLLADVQAQNGVIHAIDAVLIP